MNWKVGEAEGVLRMSNQNAISKTRSLPKGWRHGMSNARMKLGRESRKTEMKQSKLMDGTKL